MSAPRCCWWATSEYRFADYAIWVNSYAQTYPQLHLCTVNISSFYIFRTAIQRRSPGFHVSMLDGGGKEQ